MSDNTNEVDIVRLQEQVKALTEKQSEDHETLKNLQKDRDKALVWGIIVLGSGILSMVAWIGKNLLKVLPS